MRLPDDLVNIIINFACRKCEGCLVLVGGATLKPCKDCVNLSPNPKCCQSCFQRSVRPQCCPNCSLCVYCNIPKGRRTAFNYFARVNIPNIQEQCPDYRHFSLIMEVAQLWKELPVEEKKVFIEMEQADKERYDRETAFRKSALQILKDEAARGSR